MAKRTKATDLVGLAEIIVAKNPKLKELALEHKGNNYHLLKDAITPSLRAISEKLYGGQYIKQRDFVYALINECEGTARKSTIAIDF